MAKVLHKFKVPFYDSGRIKYAVGKAYEPNEETTGAVKQGHAEEVDGAKHPLTQPFGVAASKAEEDATAEAEGELSEEGKKLSGKK